MHRYQLKEKPLNQLVVSKKIMFFAEGYNDGHLITNYHFKDILLISTTYHIQIPPGTN